MKKFLKTKTREQKVTLFTVFAIAFVAFLLQLTGLSTSEKICTYVLTILGLSFIQFVILEFVLNKNRTKNNVKASLPALGTIYAFLAFFNKKIKP